MRLYDESQANGFCSYGICESMAVLVQELFKDIKTKLLASATKQADSLVDRKIWQWKNGI